MTTTIERLGDKVIDLNQTENCPCGARCECCGRESPEMQVRVWHVDQGVICLSVCPLCAKTRMTSPPITVGTAIRLAAAHERHLGLDRSAGDAAIVADALRQSS